MNPVELRRNTGYVIQQIGLLPHKTIVFVTHDMDEAIKIANRIAIMMRNELVMAGAVPAAILAILFDFVLKQVERWVTPKGLKK